MLNFILGRNNSGKTEKSELLSQRERPKIKSVYS